jgi:hypothetical protein
VGRIYDEVKGRPLYLVRALHNMPDQGDGGLPPVAHAETVRADDGASVTSPPLD